MRWSFWISTMHTMDRSRRIFGSLSRRCPRCFGGGADTNGGREDARRRDRMRVLGTQLGPEPDREPEMRFGDHLRLELGQFVAGRAEISERAVPQPRRR